MQEAINRILDRYLIEKRKKFSKNKLAHFLRSDVSSMIQGIVDSEHPNQFKVSASAGQGKWAEIPWVGVFDKEITESPTHGYFVMYVFTSDMSAVYLSLNQGWLFFKDTYGAQAKEKIASAAEAFRRILGQEERFDYDRISLKTDRELGVAYELGHIYGKKYEKGMIPGDETLKRDLFEIIALYERLKEIIGTEAPEAKIKKIISEHETAPQVSSAEFMDEAEKLETESTPEMVATEARSVNLYALSLQEVSERCALPVDETEGFLDELEKAGICSSKIIEGKRFFSLETPELVSRAAALSAEGESLGDAVEAIKEGDELDAKKLNELDQKVERLSSNIKSLSTEFESHLSKYHSTPEKKRFFYHFKQAFRSIGKKKA